ncbi:glycoside hydrolase family 13 protein [Prochlorococcus sp. MIT 1300]|uniref:glycoside hydrolase family 13 protein n=1 Tax=Prochlorococcus sp. MIT 1300 TaxID=3096218 RepID=UPI002A751AA3|nr:glycoside hydrolase family 13 protein [Prochlorococcus sp. MIT 1300]
MRKKDLLDSPPLWVAKAVVYQIFPDRFRRSGRVEAQDNVVLQPWGSDPTQHGFQGGDLYGVIQGLDHLQDLGVTCIYLNPVFCSAANHRYHTYDYFNVDPLLGGNEALFALIEALHLRGMRIILDGVFNHCGRGFWAFHHLLENGEKSPYREWFLVHKWPLTPYPRQSEECGYSCWWNDPALPKFNHHNAYVCDYLTSVACYWIEKGIDGWRLDVADEVPMSFWRNFREKVKSINNEAWIVGEIWGDARPWLDGKQFDGVMNYRIGWSSLSWASPKPLRKIYKNPDYPLKNIDSLSFIRVIKTTVDWYQEEVNCGQLNLLDSHDVPRALDTLCGDINALKLALFLLFLQQGAPCIYYGTEIGLCGGIEPSCREAFLWEHNWAVDLCAYIRSLVDLRKDCSFFLYNSFRWEAIGSQGLKGQCPNNLFHEFVREEFLVWLNRSSESWLGIEEVCSDPFFLLGEYEHSSFRLGPQSAILFRKKK